MIMKKIFTAIVALVLGASACFAQNIDTLVVVKTTSSSDTTQTTVLARVDTLGPCDDGRVHLDFDIPFYKKIRRFDDDLVGSFYVGSNITDSKAPFDFSPQNSMEFAFYMLDSKSWGRNTFSWGPGFTWRNYALTGSKLMWKDDSDGTVKIGEYIQGASPKVSKLRVFSINVPLLYSCNISHGFGFTLGPVVSFNTGSSIVNKYVLNGEKQKDKYKNVHCNVVTVDAMVQLNLRYFSIYAKYSPMNVLDKNYCPEFQTWTVGIAL